MTAGQGGGPAPAAGGAAARSRRIGIVLVLASLVFAGLCALGTWQVHRRAWKLDLIARVESRIHAEPVPAPGPDAWAGLNAAADEYRRVRASGRFRDDRETLVAASTELGSGYWVLTPLETDRGFTVLVNRGFVPPELRDPAKRPGGGAGAVVGLMRMSEPGGGFLRANDPAAGRWYSRDVAAIAAARDLGRVAPYFIDAEAATGPDAWPRGGLTVVRFPNNHLIYAITWFGLAAMLVAGCVVFVRDQLRERP